MSRRRGEGEAWGRAIIVVWAKPRGRDYTHSHVIARPDLGVFESQRAATAAMLAGLAGEPFKGLPAEYTEGRRYKLSASAESFASLKVALGLRAAVKEKTA